MTSLQQINTNKTQTEEKQVKHEVNKKEETKKDKRNKDTHGIYTLKHTFTLFLLSILSQTVFTG